MRKVVSMMFVLFFCITSTLSHAIEITVDVSGPQELSALKTAIEKTIPSRCIARGIPLESYQNLTVTISKLGDVISYDALLNTTPPRAFHKDLKDTSGISGTIDEMIGVIFAETAKSQVLPAPSIQKVPKKEIVSSKVKLPFVANSIVSAGEAIYLSDKATVYQLKGEKAAPIWHASGKIEILRIYPYGEELIVLTKLQNEFRTFRIKQGKTTERWDKAVVPIGQGLITADLISDYDLSMTSYTWSPAKSFSGSPAQVPKGFDIISAVYAKLAPSSDKPEILSYTQANRLALSRDGAILWTADTNAGIVPSYIENTEISPPARYNLKPRIVVEGGKIISFRNEQGLGSILTNINLFQDSKILVYTASDGEFEEAVVATFPASYCSDITLARGKLAALIVKEKISYLQFLDL